MENKELDILQEELEGIFENEVTELVIKNNEIDFDLDYGYSLSFENNELYILGFYGDRTSWESYNITTKMMVKAEKLIKKYLENEKRNK